MRNCDFVPRKEHNKQTAASQQVTERNVLKYFIQNSLFLRLNHQLGYANLLNFTRATKIHTIQMRNRVCNTHTHAHICVTFYEWIKEKVI